MPAKVLGRLRSPAFTAILGQVLESQSRRMSEMSSQTGIMYDNTALRNTATDLPATP
jgi:hypothetical protein